MPCARRMRRVGVAHSLPRSFTGIYVDANAVSPATARTIASAVDRYVDGGIIGPPPRKPGTTRLYLSGAEAPIVADLFAGTNVDTRVVSEDAGAASAVKMAFAAWTKGTAALLLGIRAVARAEGVDETLLDEWEISLPQHVGALGRSGPLRARKGLALGRRDERDRRHVRRGRVAGRLSPCGGGDLPANPARGRGRRSEPRARPLGAACETMTVALGSRIEITLDVFERVAWRGEPVRIEAAALDGQTTRGRRSSGCSLDPT